MWFAPVKEAEGGRRVAWAQRQPIVPSPSQTQQIKAFVIKAHLFVYPSLEFLVIYKATFLSEGGFDWAFFIPPTTEPTGWLLTGF